MGVASVANATTNSGVYLGLDLGLATSQSVLQLNSNVNSPVSIGQSSQGGLGLTAGYDFTKNIATEIGYLYISPSASSASISDSFGFASLSVSSSNQYLTANVKGTLPLNDKFSLFGKFGMGANFASVNMSGNSSLGSLSDHSSNSTNLAFLLGTGIEWNVTKEFSLHLADSYYIASAPSISDTNASQNSFSFGNTNFISVGASYNF